MNLILPLQPVTKNGETYLWYVGKFHTPTETYYQGILQTFWNPASEYCNPTKILKTTEKKKQIQDVFKEIKDNK